MGGAWLLLKLSIKCGCHKFTIVQIKISFVCYVINFRDGQSLEVVTNLCFVILIDVSKHIIM